jgi:hypoxanthine phosphoribosyltransferase
MIDTTDIQIKDLRFTQYLTQRDLHSRIHELAIDINHDYQDKKPIFVSVLNGSFMFTSDLLKMIDIDSEVNFIKVSSYDGLESTGKIVQELPFGKWVTDRHIIIVEDIVDTGRTLRHILREIQQWDPATVEIATLFLKPQSFDYDYKLAYVGFEIPDKFIVGYGLDYDGLGRNYPDVYQLV